MVSIKLDDGREVHNHDVTLTDVVGEWLKSKFLVKTKRDDDVALMVEDTMLDTQKTFEEQQIQEGKVLRVISKGQALAMSIVGKRKKANSDKGAADEAKKQEAAKVVAGGAMGGPGAAGGPGGSGNGPGGGSTQAAQEQQATAQGSAFTHFEVWGPKTGAVAALGKPADVIELVKGLVAGVEGKKIEVAARSSGSAGAPEWSIWITPGLADAQVTAAKAKLEDLWRVRHITQTLKRERATRFVAVKKRKLALSAERPTPRENLKMAEIYAGDKNDEVLEGLAVLFTQSAKRAEEGAWVERGRAKGKGKDKGKAASWDDEGLL